MDVQLLLVPYDTARRGWRCGAGPEHLVKAGLANHLSSRGHSVAGIDFIEDDSDQEAAEIRTAFELMRRLATAVRAARAAGRFPLVLSGNCNSAVGTLSGMSPAARSIFWFDAHGDCNTPDTTTTGFLDGTGLATALGMCWKQLAGTVPGFSPVSPETTFLLGARELDPSEADLITGSAITSVRAAHIPARLPEFFSKPELDDTLGYLHIDLDVLDPSVGQANWYPVAGGLSAENLVAAIAAIRARTPLGAAAITSYSPEYDRDQGVCRAAIAAIDAIVK